MKRIILLFASVCATINGMCQMNNRDLFIIVNQAGTLNSIIDKFSYQYADSITIGGTLNGSDIRTLRHMLGGKYHETDSSEGNLQYLDISNARIEGGGEDYLYLDVVSNPDLCHVYTSADTIGYYMFFDCPNMTHIRLPHGIKAIDDGAFQFSQSLKDIVVPEGVETIGSAVFRNCTSLESVTFPSSLSSIGVWAVRDCTSLKSVACAATNPPMCMEETFSEMEGVTLYVPMNCADKYKQSIGWGNFKTIIEVDPMDVHIDNAGTLESFVNTLGLVYTDRMKVAGELNGSDIRALRLMLGGKIHETLEKSNGNLHELDISEAKIVGHGEPYLAFDVMSNPDLMYLYASDDIIGYNMFYNCPNMECIRLPHGIKAIDDGAFQFSQSLKEIVVPEGVETIGSAVFRNCTSLESVTFPSSLSSIGAWVVRDCASLKSVACAATDPPICTEETFGDMEGVTLYVPMNCADKYKQKCGWRNFSAIVEVIPAGIVNVDTVPETIIQNHNLQGIRIKSNLYRGIYIQNGKKFVVK